MKRFYLKSTSWLASLLLAMLFTVGQSAWADKTVTFNAAEFATTTGTHEVTLDGVTLKARAYNVEYQGYEVFDIYPQAGYEVEVTSETNILKIECTKTTNSYYYSSANDFELTTGTYTYTGGLFTWTPTEDTKSVKFAPTNSCDLYTDAIAVTVASEQGGGGGGGNNNNDVTIQFADAHTAAGDWWLEAPYTENGVTVSAGLSSLGYYPEFTEAGRVVIMGGQDFTVAAPEGKNISKVVLNAEFTEDELSRHPNWTLDRTYTLTSGTVESKDVQTATFKDINAATFTFSSSDRVYVMNMVVTLTDAQGGGDDVKGLVDGKSYYIYTETEGKKYYLVPAEDGLMTLEAYAQGTELGHYQWTAEAKSGEGKFFDGDTYTINTANVNGFALKNVKDNVYVGAFDYDDTVYKYQAHTTAQDGAIIVMEESTDEYSKGQYSLYNATSGREWENGRWNEDYTEYIPFDDYQGYLNMGYQSYNGSIYASASNAPMYNWYLAEVSTMNPTDLNVYLVSMGADGNKKAFVVEAEGALAEDETFNAGSYDAEACNFALNSVEGGYNVKSIASGKYVTAEGLADEAVLATLTDGKLYFGNDAKYYVFEYGAEELQQYGYNLGNASWLAGLVTEAEAIDQTQYPEALMTPFNAALQAAKNADKFNDSYSDLAQALQTQLNYVKEYVPGSLQVVPAAGFQGYVMNSSLNKAMGIVDGKVIVADIDAENDKNFVWALEENGQGLAFRNLGTNQYLSYVHYMNCAGYEHEDFNVDDSALYPELVASADEAHAFSFPAGDSYFHGGGYLIKDYDPCTVPGAFKWGEDYESPYLYATEFDGEIRLFANENEWASNSGWKFLQLETPYVDAPFVVNEEVVYDPFTQVTLTFNREVKVLNANGAVLMHKVEGEQEGVEITLSQASGKGADYTKVLVAVKNLDGVKAGAYDVLIAEGAIADRANDKAVVGEYAVTIEVSPSVEPNTFVPASYTPNAELAVESLEAIKVVFDEWPTLVGAENEVALPNGDKLMLDEEDYYAVNYVLSKAVTTPGTYTYVIPEGYIYNGLYDDSAEDKGVSAGALYNPEITLTVKVEGADGITSINLNVNGKSYNVAGQRINNNAKGVIVVDGKKLIRK